MSIIGAITEEGLHPYVKWDTKNTTDIFNPTMHELKVGSSNDEVYLRNIEVKSNYPLWYFLSNPDKDLYIEKIIFQVESNITALSYNGLKISRGQKTPNSLSFRTNGNIEFLKFWYKDDSISAPIEKTFTFGLYGQKPTLQNLISEDWKIDNFQKIITKNITNEELPPEIFPTKPTDEEDVPNPNVDFKTQVEEYSLKYLKPLIESYQQEGEEYFFVDNLFEEEKENKGLVFFTDTSEINITLSKNTYSKFITLNGDYKVLKVLVNDDKTQESWGYSNMFVYNNDDNIQVLCVYETPVPKYPYILIGVPK